MRKPHGPTLRTCSRALRRISGAVDIDPTKDEIASMNQVRGMLEAYVHELTKQHPRKNLVGPVLQILREFHPRIDYTVPERAQLDLVDMGLTLARLTQGRHRDDKQKIIDACMFFLTLAEEV